MRDWLTVELVLATLLVTSFTCVGLLALWATTSPRHWFVRTVVVLAILALALLIPAYEPLIVFALQTCVVVAGVQVWQWRARRRRCAVGESSSDLASARHNNVLRFSLTTLLLFTAVVAAMATIFTRVVMDAPPQNVGSLTTLALNGVVSGCAVLLGAWLITARRKWIAWPAALVACIGLAGIMARFDWLLPSTATRQSWPPTPQASAAILTYRAVTNPELAWFVVVPAITGAVWLLVYLCFVGAGINAVVGVAGRRTPHRRQARQIAALCVFALALALLAIPSTYVFWKLLHPLPIPKLTPPQSNGLDDILAAGRAFYSSPILNIDVEPKSTDELATEVAKYSAAYKQLRRGLSREIRVPRWPPDGDSLTAFNRGLGDIQHTRAAARGLDREAELAQRQHRFGDAARISLKNMRMGQAITRDGLLIDFLVGIAIEGIGDWTLYRALPKLDSDQCHHLIAELTDIDRGREPLDYVLYRDRIWSEHAYGWYGHFLVLLNYFVHPDYLYEPARHSLRRKQAVTRLLIVEAALRAFQTEHGRMPERLEQLTPAFLADIPVDPFDTNGGLLRYVRTDGYLVYSVGFDGDDGGGRPPSRDESGSLDYFGDGDFRLDEYLADVPSPTSSGDAATDESEGAEPIGD